MPSARVKKQRGTRFSANHTPRYLAFLKLFRQARADAGMTQREVARELGRLQSYVEKCEHGTRRVDASELFQFARIYEKPVEFFDPDADGKGPRRRPSAGSRTPPSATA